MFVRFEKDQPIFKILPSRPKITRIEQGMKEEMPELGLLFHNKESVPKKHDMLVLACDGLFDVLTSKEVGEKVRQ